MEGTIITITWPDNTRSKFEIATNEWTDLDQPDPRRLRILTLFTPLPTQNDNPAQRVRAAVASDFVIHFYGQARITAGNTAAGIGSGAG